VEEWRAARARVGLCGLGLSPAQPRRQHPRHPRLYRRLLPNGVSRGGGNPCTDWWDGECWNLAEHLLYEDRWDTLKNEDHSVLTYVYVCAWEQQAGAEVQQKFYILVASANTANHSISSCRDRMQLPHLLAYSTFEKGRHVSSEMNAVTEVALDIWIFFLIFLFLVLKLTMEIKFISTIHCLIFGKQWMVNDSMHPPKLSPFQFLYISDSLF
jgi:hypothetical protein